jgi:tRNA (guanine26-N2/guanine27-N2)-dimethyltransferase
MTALQPVFRVAKRVSFLKSFEGTLLFRGRTWSFYFESSLGYSRHIQRLSSFSNFTPGRRKAMANHAPMAAAPITAPPVAGQLVEHDGKVLTTVKEGLAYILIPPEAPLLTNPTANPSDGPQRASVFYNPIQQYNRDLTVLVIKAFGEDFVSKAEAVTAKRNKSKKPRPPRRVREAAVKDDILVHEEPKVLQTVQSEAPSEQAETAKRKRESLDDDHSMQSSEAHSLQKKMKPDSDALPAPFVSHDPPLFSSMIKERIETQEDIDDSFGDGGIAEEDFIQAEQNARQAGMLAAEEQPQNGTSSGQNQEHAKNDTPRKQHIQFRILDALSASGLRALRYAKELPFATSITANDLSADAVASIKVNIEHNAFTNSNLIKVNTGNAVAHMANFIGSVPNKYTVIDLDPYGTAVPFLDTAIQAVADNGLLCVTCTDTAIFNSMGYLEKTFSQYGGLPVKGDFCHEAGVRLILHAIASTAGKYGIAIEPLLSLSIDYYARVFVRVRRSAAEVKLLGGKTMVVYNCDSGCTSWTAQPLVRIQEKKEKNGTLSFKFSAAQGPTTTPLCEHCGFKRHLAGPMWGGPLHNPAFIERILDIVPKVDPEVYQTVDRITGMLTTALEETSMYEVPESIATKAKNSHPAPDETYTEFARVPAQIIDKHPFYFDASSLARVLHSVAPSNAAMQGALRHLGYRSVRSHAKPGSIKTDAPFKVLWRIMKAWVAKQTIYKEPKVGTAGHKLWNTEIAPEEGEKEINFDENLGRQDAPLRGLVRYQQNPRENWGPMARAKGSGKPKKVDTVEAAAEG